MSADPTGASVSRFGSSSSPGLQHPRLPPHLPAGVSVPSGRTGGAQAPERGASPLGGVVRPCPPLIWQAARAPRGGARAGESRPLRPASVSAGALLPRLWCRASARSAGEERGRGGAPRDSAPQLPSRSPGARLARLGTRRGPRAAPAPPPRVRGAAPSGRPARCMEGPVRIAAAAAAASARGDDLGVALGAGCRAGGLGA